MDRPGSPQPSPHLTVSFQEGRDHHAAGRLEQAYNIYLQVAEAEPGHVDCHFRMGLLTAQIGRNDLALQHLATTIALQPREAGYHLQLGMVLDGLGRFEEAVSSYRTALGLRPDYPHAHNNLANTLGRLGRLEDAESHYRAALALNPAMAEAHNNLGHTLNRLGRVVEAEGACRLALKLRPNYAAALSNLGVALVGQGRNMEAEASYRESLRLKPDATALRTLGGLLAKSGRTEEAGACYREAVRLKPDDALSYKAMADLLAQHRHLEQAATWYREALLRDIKNADSWNRLGLVLNTLGRQGEAVTCFDKILEAKPDFRPAQVNRCMARLPVIYRDESQIDHARTLFAEELEAICRLPADALGLESISVATPFFLAYQGLPNRDLQARYGRLVATVMAAHYPEWSTAPDVPAPLPGEKIRVGFLSPYFCNHSNWKIPLKGWLAGLDKGRFEIFGYHPGNIVDDDTATAKALCHRFVQGLIGHQDWAETIRADRLHVLVIPGIGLDALSTRLAALRLAPVQAASWGHPDTTGLPTVDHYLSSALMEPEDADAHYTERLIRLPNLSIAYEPLTLPPVALFRAEIGVPEDAIFYWCCQVLFKYLPRYDWVFPRIAAAVPRACFVFVEYPQGTTVTQIFRERLNTAFAAVGLDADRHCVFVPPLSTERFGAVGRLADVFLDSLGWSGCNTTFEALANDLPVVTMAGDLMRSRHGSAILTMLGMPDMIAQTPEEFTELAIALGRDPHLRQALRGRIARDKHRLYHDQAAIDGLAGYLEEAAASIAVSIGGVDSGVA